jgi:hypothetical protein
LVKKFDDDVIVVAGKSVFADAVSRMRSLRAVRYGVPLWGHLVINCGVLSSPAI